jgi:hypothetical protein
VRKNVAFPHVPGFTANAQIVKFRQISHRNAKASRENISE